LELIKKIVKQALTITGVTDTSYEIVPNLATFYCFKINLTTEDHDFGFFDVYENTNPVITGGTYSSQITGITSSRLNELKKYAITSVFEEKYVSGGTNTVDGVDYDHSTENESIVYYINGMQYNDSISGTGVTTIYSLTPMSVNKNNFTSGWMYKNPEMGDVISDAKIDSDVFIDRQELSAFEKNYRLEFVKTLSQLTTYAGGGFFNIIKNT
jgi:hypothetical protein